jgi:hypothetical protein
MPTASALPRPKESTSLRWARVCRVVQVPLAQPPWVVARAAEGLPAAEAGVSPRRRLARAVVRELLGAELGVAPGDVEITRECRRCGDPSHGKPRLAGGASPSFSVSHSGDLAIVALSRDACVGVDVELVRPRLHLDRLAARVLTPAELAGWRAVPEAMRLERFLERWTAKEALLKASGIGLATPLAHVALPAPGWWVHGLALPPGYVGALALDRGDVEITTATWRPSFTPSAGTGG